MYTRKEQKSYPGNDNICTTNGALSAVDVLIVHC